MSDFPFCSTIFIGKISYRYFAPLLAFAICNVVFHTVLFFILQISIPALPFVFPIIVKPSVFMFSRIDAPKFRRCDKFINKNDSFLLRNVVSIPSPPDSPSPEAVLRSSPVPAPAPCTLCLSLGAERPGSL